jgi:undecaprenyl-phosphate galactose phosphotransferase
MIRSLAERLAAFLALAALSPVFLAIAISIKLEDRGAILFAQDRVGRKRRAFSCLKFRTMHEGADALLLAWKLENNENWKRYVASNFKLKDDPRVTRVGRFLRRTSLDELPQLINIAKGEMRFVGPRPLLDREVPDYGAASFEKYCEMTPGLTGLWQVSGRSNTTFQRRAEMDVEYYGKRSLGLDAIIVLRTFRVIFRKDGAY